MHPVFIRPVFAAIAVDAVVTYSCTTYSAWGTHMNSIGGPSLYHISLPLSLVHLPIIPSPHQEPPGTFLHRVSDDDKIIYIKFSK